MPRIRNASWRWRPLTLVCAGLMYLTVRDANSEPPSSPPDPRIAADVIVNVKRIWTGDRAHPWAEAASPAAVRSSLSVTSQTSCDFEDRRPA